MLSKVQMLGELRRAAWTAARAGSMTKTAPFSLTEPTAPFSESERRFMEGTPSTAEAAQMFGITKTQIWQALRRKDLSSPSKISDRVFLWRTDELEQAFGAPRKAMEVHGLTRREAAELLGVCEEQVSRYHRAGRLGAPIRVGTSNFYDPRDVLRLKAEREYNYRCGYSDILNYTGLSFQAVHHIERYGALHPTLTETRFPWGVLVAWWEDFLADENPFGSVFGLELFQITCKRHPQRADRRRPKCLSTPLPPQPNPPGWPPPHNS